MATQRYSGSVRIRITYLEKSFDPKRPQACDEYRCHVVAPNKRITVYVRPPAHLDTAVDAPEAFDSVASAAIVFADHEAGMLDGNSGSEFSQHAAYTDSGVEISRRP